MEYTVPTKYKHVAEQVEDISSSDTQIYSSKICNCICLHFCLPVAYNGRVSVNNSEGSFCSKQNLT